MGYDNQFAAIKSPIIFDLETAPLPDAAAYLEPVQAAKNLKDPAKIAADIAEKSAEQLDKCGLDYNTARIVCLGYMVDDDVPVTMLLQSEEDERGALHNFWQTQQGRKLIGFRIRDFDLPMLIQRSRYLGVKYPDIDLGRYSRAGRVIDLFDLLTFQDSQRTFAMRRTLHSFCRRFGIPVADEVSGSDIATLVAEQQWGEIAAHCGSDIRLTKALAERLGVLDVKVSQPMPSTAEIVDKLRERRAEPVL